MIAGSGRVPPRERSSDSRHRGSCSAIATTLRSLRRARPWGASSFTARLTLLPVPSLRPAGSSAASGPTAKFRGGWTRQPKPRSTWVSSCRASRAARTERRCRRRSCLTLRSESRTSAPAATYASAAMRCERSRRVEGIELLAPLHGQSGSSSRLAARGSHDARRWSLCTGPRAFDRTRASVPSRTVAEGRTTRSARWPGPRFAR